MAVFNRLGGTAGMADWAREHPTDFYKIYGRLVPQEVEASVEGSLSVQVITGVPGA